MKEKFINEEIKQHYNTNIQDRYGGEYEFKRWFSSSRLMLDYTMHYRALSYHLANISFHRCLEIGPGPGTWTRLLYRHNPKASFDLVDISGAMREQFQLEMRAQPSVNYIVEDIMAFEQKEPYDFVFSSRAFEYFDDKPRFIKKLHSFLKIGGTGMIITKNPTQGFLRTNTHIEHSGDIKPDDLVALLRAEHFTDIKVYPVIIWVPFLSRLSRCLSEKLSEGIFRKSFTRPLTKTLFPYTESYLISLKRR